MNLRGMAVVAIAIVFSSLGSGANPNQAEDIVRRSVANTNADWAAAPQYDFTERDTITRNGKQTTKTYRVLMIEGSTYNKLIAVDGRPLSAAQAQGENQKLQQEIKRRRSESPSERQKRVAEYQKERRQDHALMSEMVKAFDYTLIGEESVNGRRCFVLQAKPKPGYTPPNRDTQVLRGMRGQMWVDAEQYQWARVHAEVFQPVRFGLFFAQVKPGTEFTLEQKPVEGKLWLPSHFAMNVKARIFLSSRTSADDEVYSDYRHATAQYGLGIPVVGSTSSKSAQALAAPARRAGRAPDQLTTLRHALMRTIEPGRSSKRTTSSPSRLAVDGSVDAGGSPGIGRRNEPTASGKVGQSLGGASRAIAW